jgi:L-lactate dehydrogenase complex protein LldG
MEGRKKMSARDDIYARLRTSLDAGGSINQRRTAVADRIAAPPRIALMERVHNIDLVETFKQRAGDLGVTLSHVAALADLGPAVADYLRAHNLAQTAKISPDLANLNVVWPASLDVTAGGTDGNDPVGVALARAGVAETGTVVMASGAASPTKLNYLPESHIVVLAASAIVASYEQGLDIARGQDQAALLPRTINWISGPSRTADIEQTILVGVHGPKRIHIVIVDDLK